MSYKHLTTFERSRIEVLKKLGYSARKIGKEIGRHHSTIARELKRNNEQMYNAETAHKKYCIRRKNSKPKGKYSKALVKQIERGLNSTYSPEQIANTLTKGVVSFKTIYRWIYKGIISTNGLKLLRHKGKRHKPKETRGRFNIGKSISKRPKEIKKRTTFGHWELDTIVSSRGESKGCFATFAERKTRMYIAIKIPDRTASSMENAVRFVANILPKKAFKTATVDRGKEFACYSNIERDLNIPFYFADPYSSWQRGTNENSNGLLREFFPKKTDLAKVSYNDLQKALFLINSRPRKCLKWKSAYEVFFHELSLLT